MTQNNKQQSGLIATCVAVFIAMSIAFALTGCSSTELVDTPQPAETKGQTITLNISCPEAEASTRADNDLHAGHVLRYSAILYSGGDLRTATQKARREIIVSTDIDQPQEMVFKVEEGEYHCIVFADYIKSDAQPSNDKFEDLYYNTQCLPEHIYMRSFIDFSTATKENTPVEDINCFNNENYDCFIFVKKDILKDANEKIIDVTLQRIVSRVGFVSNTSAPNGSTIKNISFSKFDFYGNYNVLLDNASHNASNDDIGLGPFVCDEINVNQDNELFFFYTLARTDGYTDNGLFDLEFTVNFSDGTYYPSSPYKIPSKTIKPAANYKITVKGSFLSEPTMDLGDLILNIAVPNFEGWNIQKPIDVEEK